MTRLQQYPQATFLFLALLVNLAATAAVRNLAAGPHRGFVEFGALADLTLTVPALYYLLLVRPGLRPGPALAGVGLLGLFRASFMIPALAPGREWVAAAGEAALLAGAAAAWRKLRATASDADPVERLRLALSGILPFPAAERPLAGELAVLYYALSPGLRPHVPERARPFTVHRRAALNEMILYLGLVALLEVVPVHLVASRWSPSAAWALTALSLYGGLWALALSRSFAARPCYLTEDSLVLRTGLLFSLEIPLDRIRSVGASAIPGAYPVPRHSEPDVYLGFNGELTGRRMAGLPKKLTAVGLSADEPGIPEAIRAAISARSSQPQEPGA